MSRFTRSGENIAAANKNPPLADADVEEEKIEQEIDETLKDTFPASDPPSWTLGTDHRVPPKDERNTGTSGRKISDASIQRKKT